MTFSFYKHYALGITYSYITLYTCNICTQTIRGWDNLARWFCFFVSGNCVLLYPSHKFKRSGRLGIDYVIIDNCGWWSFAENPDFGMKTRTLYLGSRSRLQGTHQTYAHTECKTKREETRRARKENINHVIFNTSRI